ncbi:CbtA family protein [Nocardioides sambongensis]|uniref:CbtA family protein n=1 Tax=Nocardioides sambongensis TaxID=2589074 RepID=UPI00112652C2|nr:CbtA family protein [Nocardioides sambongensis]
MDSQHTPALTPAAFVVRGLAAGLAAGLIAFLVAFALGEPHIDDAIALEEAASADATPADIAAEEAEADEPGMVEVSRENQKSWGLLTGTLAIGAALGGLISLAAAGALGRLGSLSPRASTALVAGLGFVAVALVPFLKYPATPPAVGSGDTIGSRTAEYFAMLLVSVLAMIAAVLVANRLRTRLDPWTAVGVAGLGYLVVVGVAAALLPTVNELGAFPADTLWYFRRSSLFTLAALWATLGVGLVASVGRLTDRVRAEDRRRALAATL